MRAPGAGSSRGRPGRWLLVALLVSLAVEIECPARAENTPRAEREATCRSYATLLARVAADRERAGATNVLAAESVIRAEMSDAPARALDGMLALVERAYRERWTPEEARARVGEECPGWLPGEKGAP